MTKKHPNEIKKFSKVSFLLWTLITLFYYLPYFCGKYAEKLNIMTERVYGNDYKKIKISAPFIGVLMTITAVPIGLLGPVFLIANALSWDLTMFTAPLSEVWSMIGEVIGSPIVTAGAVGIWLFIVVFGLLYCWNKSKELNNRTIELARYYGRYDILYAYKLIDERDLPDEYNPNISGKEIKTFFDIINGLIRCHNDSFDEFDTL